MATSTLRFALIVALVVGGIVLIDQAFPKTGLGASPPVVGSPSGSPTPSGATSPTPPGSPSPRIVGVKIGVFNGAGVTGLASETAIKLEKKYGYVSAQVADAPQPVSVTTLYYRSPQDKIEAEALASRFFPTLQVHISRLPAGTTNVKTSVQVAIYLGDDYAATQG